MAGEGFLILGGFVFVVAIAFLWDPDSGVFRDRYDDCIGDCREQRGCIQTGFPYKEECPPNATSQCWTTCEKLIGG